ncbi:MAG: AAA family ATPase [Nanoarchaeota archaeon]|nr:AAA family ATPase [Nanoarchaeota archaeon]
MNQLIIGITGTLGAGKGTIVDYLVEHKGFAHYSVRAFLIEEIKERGLPNNRDSMVLVANDLRARYSPSYIVEQLYEQALARGKPAIIESIRAVGEVEKLKEKKNFFLLSVDATPEIRYRRIQARKSSTDDVTFNEFVANEKREMTTSDPNKQNISACMKQADFSLDNNESFEHLYGQVEEILQVIQKKEKESKKRENYLSWDDYFMGVALLSAQRSKDPNTQVGACIVNSEKRIVGIGYNGWPTGIKEDDLPWSREGSYLETKYPYVVHAEKNAIANATTDLKGATIYVSLSPCNSCAQLIIQKGIKEVVYMSDKYKDVDVFIAGAKILELAGVKRRQFIPHTDRITVNLKEN